MKQPQIKSKGQVVPFTGEFYPHSPPIEQQPQAIANSFPAYLSLGCCLVAAGVALGASLIYNSTSQVELRAKEAQIQQLDQVKKTLCKE